jgi:ferritin-like protein
MSARMTRSHLLSLISEASELEHALACSYLFAAFSLKRGQVDGLSWQQEQTVRRWAAQVYFIASQEMLHLAQTWNLALACGGTPYFARPSFPQPKGYLPIDAPLTLEGYSRATLERFLQWEAPLVVQEGRGFQPSLPAQDTDAPYSSVGELYARIEDAIQSIPESELFITDPALQVGSDLADFPDLIQVSDRASAVLAVQRIRAQGEGSPKDREDCHFGVFFDLRQELDGPSTSPWSPAHPVVANPSLVAAPGVYRVEEPAVRAAMRMFDDVYATMLRLLGWVFGTGDPRHDWTRCAARAAIAAMPIVLKPLGETLATLQINAEGATAGAPFSPMRHVPLPEDENIARRLVFERFEEIDARARELLCQHAPLAQRLPWLPDQLGVVSRLLRA